jgi:hypothetical protein
MCDTNKTLKLSPQNHTTHLHLTPKLKMRGFYLHPAETYVLFARPVSAETLPRIFTTLWDQLGHAS